MTDFEKYIQTYLELIPSENWISEMQIVSNQTVNLYREISEEQGDFAYAEGKWSFKLLLQHLIDTEKVFAYRALRFSRRDKSLVSGFDENTWAENSFAKTRSLESLIVEFELTRKLSLLFFTTLPKQAFGFTGFVIGNEISVEQIGTLIVGHNIHHLNVIRERYLPRIKNKKRS